MASVYRGPTRGYKLTETDVLWLARAFIGEAGYHVTGTHAAWLFWAWIGRFLLLDARWNRAGWDFTRFLQSHSQPINPLWTDAHGEKCQRYPKYCTQAHLQRRREIQSLTVEELRELGVYQLALDAQNGELEDPYIKPLYDFAACSLTRKQNRPDPGIDVGGNCFLPFHSLKPGERAMVITDDDGRPYTVSRTWTPPSRVWFLAVPIMFLIGYGIQRVYERLTER